MAVSLAGVCFFVVPKLAWWHVTHKYVRIWEQEKRPKLVAAAEAAQPIIDALDAHERDHGRYPEELAALVPEYLDSVPKPQAPLLYGWQYGPLREGTECFLLASAPQNYYGVPIQAPTDAEWLVYESDGTYEDYPLGLLGGNPMKREPLARLGDWAYYAWSSTPPREG